VTPAAQWQEIVATLPARWHAATLRLRLEDAGQADRAVAILAPLQPVRSAPATLSFRTARDRGGPSPEMLVRLLELLGRERLHGTLELVSSEERAPAVRAASAPGAASLPASWDAALATLPADWSDLLAEVELLSSDFLERAALHLAPINPRRDHDRLALRFRGARSFGYGGSPQMVRRCFERCDEDGIRGSVSVLRALSQTRPVGTQGPVWLLDGRTV